MLTIFETQQRIILRVPAIIGMVFFLIVATLSVVSAQVSKDLNPHLKASTPNETIVYTALQKGYVSIKAKVALVDGILRSEEGQRFEDLYLKPLFERYQEQGHIYKNYNGLFYLFIEINAGDDNTAKALHKTLTDYQDMIASHHWKTQAKPLKVVLINATSTTAAEVQNKNLPLFALEGDVSVASDSISYQTMPVVGINYEQLVLADLRKTIRSLRHQGKKLRLYNVPEDQNLWKSLMDSGVDFINTEQTPEILAQNH